MTNIGTYHQYRGVEYNPERDTWPQKLEEYKYTQIQQRKIQNRVFLEQAEMYILKVHWGRKEGQGYK